MVNGLNSGNPSSELGRAAVNVLDQFDLGVGRACDQNYAGIRNRRGNPSEEFLVFRSVSAADGARLVVQMAGWMIGMDSVLLGLRGIEMKDSGFPMIDPKHRMIVGCHWHFLQGCRPDSACCGTPRIAIQGSFALRYVKMPVPMRTAVDGAVVCLVPLIAVGEALQCLDIEKFDLIAGRQLDQPKLLELCEGPANCLDGPTEEVADIGTGHRQFEARRMLGIALIATRKSQKKAGHPHRAGRWKTRSGVVACSRASAS
jgi:hypothetical protein